MIDSQHEQLVTFGQAADCLPRRRRGQKIHVSTIYRWTTVGCRGVVLESIQIGGSRCTSWEALQRFFERLSASDGAEAVTKSAPTGRTLAGRRRASAEAGRRLEQMGA